MCLGTTHYFLPRSRAGGGEGGRESRGFQGERRENQSLQTDYKTKTIEHRLLINCQCRGGS